MLLRNRRPVERNEWISISGRPWKQHEAAQEGGSECRGYICERAEATGVNPKTAGPRSAAASATRASRAQIQAIFDNSPDWLTLFRATAAGRFIYVDLNYATERAYGLRYDEVVGRTVEEILGPQQAELPLRLMRACIRTGENQRYTAQRTMAGVTRSIDVMFVRVREPLDGDYYIMATARDITERNEIEERLYRDRLLFELVIESTSEGIIVVDDQLRHLIWNAAMERINGGPRSAVLGKRVFEVFPEFSDHPVGRAWRRRALGTAS